MTTAQQINQLKKQIKGLTEELKETKAELRRMGLKVILHSSKIDILARRTSGHQIVGGAAKGGGGNG